MAKSVAKAAGMILFINLAVKILGFLREAFIANAFGASAATDAYLVAYTLPYFLQAVLGYALVTAVVPAVNQYLEAKNNQEAWHVSSALINLTTVVLAICSIIGVCIAKYLVFLTAPAFPPEQMALATKLTMIMFPSLLFMGVGMVINGIGNAGYRFANGAFAPGFSNIIIILSVVLFSSRYGIEGLAVGTLISFFGFFLIQIPVLRKMGFRYEFTFDFRHPAVKKVAGSIFPIVLGVSVNQIYFAINRIFASGLAEGSISALNYANKLMQLPVGIFVAAVASAIYPALSAFALKEDKKELNFSLQKGIGLVALIAVPAMVGLMILRQPIVSLVYERGAFGAEDTIITAAALLYFCVGLVPYALNMVLTRAFYSIGNTKAPLLFGMFSIVFNVLFSVVLLKPMGHCGLALANSLAALINTGLLYFYWQKNQKAWDGKPLWKNIAKIAVASIIMAVVVELIKDFGGNTFGTGSMGVLLTSGIGILLGVVVYMLAAFLLKVDYLKQIKEMFSKNSTENTTL